MRILNYVAQRIINEVTKVISEEVIVMDKAGEIIAASDRKRIGTIHEGSLEVIRTKKKLIISDDEVFRLKGVKVGLNLPILFQYEVIGVIGITGSNEETIRYGELIQRMTELIIGEAYTAERLESELRGLETFVSEWLYSDSMTEDVIDRGEVLGIDMSVARYCVLIEYHAVNEDDPLSIDLELYRKLQSLLQRDEQQLLVRWGRGKIVYLPSAAMLTTDTLIQVLENTIAKLEQTFSVTVKMACSRPYYADQLHLAYKEAKRAITVKSRKEKAISYDSFTLELILSETKEKTKIEFIEKVLGPLMTETDLLETLQTYFDYHLSVKDSANALHIHVNTLHYRLKQIQKLTNIELKEVKGLTSLYIALMYYDEDKMKIQYNKGKAL